MADAFKILAVFICTIAFIARASAQPGPGGWREGHTIGVRTDSPASAQVIFLNTFTGVETLNGVTQGGVEAPNVFHDLDITPLGVPETAIGVFIACNLVITSGQTSSIPDLAIGFQAPGGLRGALWPARGLETPHNFQAISIGPSGGARTSGAVIAPVVGSKIAWAWIRGDGVTWPSADIPSYPSGAAYGINCSLESYVAP